MKKLLLLALIVGLTLALAMPASAAYNETPFGTAGGTGGPNDSTGGNGNGGMGTSDGTRSAGGYGYGDPVYHDGEGGMCYALDQNGYPLCHGPIGTD